MAVTRLPVRAKVEGGGLYAETPNVLSFYVRKSRGELDTFNASLKVKTIDIGQVTNSGFISVWAGSPDAHKKLWTGVLTSVKMRPCFDDPTYVIVDITGTDVRKGLQGKKFSRRQKTSRACWLEITAVNRKGLRSQKLLYTSKGPYIDGIYLTDDILNNTNIETNSRSKSVFDLIYNSNLTGPSSTKELKINAVIEGATQE